MSPAWIVIMPLCREDQTAWVDQRGHFHSLWHAWWGQNNTYPRDCHTAGCTAPTDSDGCRRTQPCSETTPGMQGGCTNGFQWPGPCTSLGGHAYSVDGRQWYISPVAPFNASTVFADGSTVMWRARERPHVITNAHGESHRPQMYNLSAAMIAASARSI